MSIIISGIDMPTNCTRCPCSDDGTRFCRAANEYIPMLGKPNFCPLVEAEERETGKWIKIPEFCGDDVSGFIDNHFSCSECKKEAEINSWGFYILSDFCPHCGARMVQEGEDNDS